MLFSPALLGFPMLLGAIPWPTHAMPLMICVLCIMAISYRYYSAFLAAKVAALDDGRTTPAVAHEDGQNYEPTNKWVLFGHHFAAISGAGPLIGPVLAAQFGYMPGILWIVIGVCLGGAAQDFLVLAASIRREGRSLAQIARQDVGKWAGGAAAIAILFILVIALAGLGKVVVNTLGGEKVKYPAGSVLSIPTDNLYSKSHPDGTILYQIPSGAMLITKGSTTKFPEEFDLVMPAPIDEFSVPTHAPAAQSSLGLPAAKNEMFHPVNLVLPPGSYRLRPGSAWGTFTIACTIPIALFVGLYMYRIRRGKVIEASVIGGLLTLLATFAGGWVSHQSWGSVFNLSADGVIWSMAIYGFIAAVLPVWVLLVPRDYLSSFMKIGTIILLVAGTLIANPKLEAPAFNHVFMHGGPIVPGNIFPFLFITIMCGAISGFHALVSSGTTPKMVRKESDARMIGYGAMLIEGLVAVVAMVAAATLPSTDYYAMNTALDKAPQFQQRIDLVGGDLAHPQLQSYEENTQESLRGRPGGAVTLAVGMAHIFDRAAANLWHGSEATLKAAWKYWYHFAIMFEALFILTTIDAGTRIGRFLLQEVFGKIHPKLGQTSWLPGAILSTALIVLGWVYFISSSSMADIWPMFGICNQMLAVIALAIISAYLANEGRAKYIWVTATPMLVVATTTTTAAGEMLATQYNTYLTQLANYHAGLAGAGWAMFHAGAQATLIAAMLICGAIILISAIVRIWHSVTGTHSRGFPIAAAAT